jgi:TRAP-type C4-dicarboxylate transport system substrate-binding protein
MVKVEGTLDELRELFVEGAKKEARKQAKEAGVKVVRSAAKKTRKVAKSAWQKFIGQKKNQIKFKSGKRKGQLDLKRMGVAYRRMQKKR